MKILYVHGYNGDPYGDSYNNLKFACGNAHELFTIDYDAAKPIETIATIHNFVRANKIELIIGTSLGGFLTMNVSGVSRIVVNPCWDPTIELPKIGYDGPMDDYKFLLNTLTSSVDFEEYHLCSGVFSFDDEILGLKYADIFKKYFKQQFFIAGPHRITQPMSFEIINDILVKHENEATDFCRGLKDINNAPWLD